MTDESFIGDDWRCGCGNRPHTDGFYPCRASGEYVDPSAGAGAGGDLYRCARCDAIIEADPVTGDGMRVGRCEPRFLDTPPP